MTRGCVVAAIASLLCAACGDDSAEPSGTASAGAGAAATAGSGASSGTGSSTGGGGGGGEGGGGAGAQGPSIPDFGGLSVTPIDVSACSTTFTGTGALLVTAEEQPSSFTAYDATGSVWSVLSGADRALFLDDY